MKEILFFNKTAGQWQAVTGEKIFPANQTAGLAFDVRFVCNAPCDLNQGDEAYIDDIELIAEDFYDYPKEQKAFMMFVR